MYQSYIYGGAEPERAVDGNSDGAFDKYNIYILYILYTCMLLKNTGCSCEKLAILICMIRSDLQLSTNCTSNRSNNNRNRFFDPKT